MNHPVTKIMLAAALLAVPILANAQPSVNDPKTPVDSGAIIMPPTTDPKAVKPAPGNVDPGAVKPAPENVEPNTPTQADKKVRPKRAAQNDRGTDPGMKRSKEADCKGPAALCKQDSSK